MTTTRAWIRLLYVCLAVVLIGCSGDQSTKPQPTFGTGEITGRVMPMHDGVTVTLNDGHDTASVDVHGSFRFSNLETGAHTVVVESPSYSTRRIHDVVVRENVIVVMGDVPLSSYPAPFFQSIPASGTTGVGLNDRRFLFYTDEPFDPDKLQAATSIEPSLAFSWGSLSYPRVGWSYTYALQFDYGELKVGTKYTLKIDGSLFTESGVQLNHDLIMTFTTGPLEVSTWAEDDDLPDHVPLMDPKIYLDVNGEADLDSLNKAISFNPPLPGEWRYLHRSNYHRYYQYVIDGYIGADVEYTMTVEPSIALVDTLHLQTPLIYQFHTEPYRAVRVIPKTGEELVRPATIYSVSVKFNIPVDTTTAAAAFSLTTTDGFVYTGKVGWGYDHREIGVGPVFSPTPGETYIIRVDTELRFVDGGSLPEPFVSVFYIK